MNAHKSLGPCGSNVTCINTNGGFTCDCAPHSYLINHNSVSACVHKTDCEAYPQLCQNLNAFCVPLEGYVNYNNYECRCPRSYYSNSLGYCVVGRVAYIFNIYTNHLYNEKYADPGSKLFARMERSFSDWANYLVKTHSQVRSLLFELHRARYFTKFENIYS